jgi:hypothetical protein
VAPEPTPGGETDGPDAVEQLQRAVLTLIGASRVALDALEALVADRRRLDDLAGNGREFVGTLRSAVSGWCGEPATPTDGENCGTTPT